MTASTQPGAALTHLPRNGRPPGDLWAEMEEASRGDVDWRAGMIQGYVYAVGDDVMRVAEEAFCRFFATSPLSPKVFPSLQRFSSDIIAMSGELLHAQEPIGTITTGGTETNLLAVLSARERGRIERGITAPEIVLPRSAHPSFNKAAHLFGLTVVRVPTGPDLRGDVAALSAALTDNTVLMVGSAPSYTHGVVDPIADMAAIADRRGISFHVDACVGGFFLPFAEKLGHEIPVWDFRVPGVSTISADLHKHGYAAKGASVLLHRNAQLRQYHTFEFNGWPNGRYYTQTIAGTRAGGAIAAAWAVMNYLGESGYLKIAEDAMRLTRAFIDGINAIPELEVWGEPVMNKFGYGSRVIDITAVADVLEEKGWYVGRQQEPPGINMHVFPVHGPIVGTYLRDLEEAVERVGRGEVISAGKAASYT
jgi:sphinganine-1-phosphate aldolase